MTSQATEVKTEILMVASEVPQDLALPDKDTLACPKFNYEEGPEMKGQIKDRSHLTAS